MQPAFLTPVAVHARRARAPGTSPRMVATDAPQTAASPSPPATPPLFGRIVTAMVTPFKRGGSEVDYATAEQLAAHLVNNGSDALLIAGTTGECPTLTWSEQYELFTVVRNAVGSRAKLIAGAGSNSTAEAVEATRRAAKLGLDGTLQVVPYYNKPPQEGIYRHFRAIADAEPDLPVMLYNIPSRTGIDMRPETTSRLARVDNIVAIKQAVSDMDTFVEIRKTSPPDFSIYAGDDGMTLPFLAVGADGGVSIASHFIGPQLQDMVKKFMAGDVAGASEIHMKYARLFSELFCMTNPIPTKTALRLQGWSVGGCRLPLVDGTPEVEKRMRDVLEELGLL